jgi:hypothetical protein
MSSQASSDAVLEPVQAYRGSLRFRLGITFRRPLQTGAAPDPLPARYLRIQVASPPPRRIDGTDWSAGLRVDDGSENGSPFDPEKPLPAGARVFPLEGLAPFGQPAPESIVLDRWLAVPAVPRTSALTRTFELADPGPGGAGPTNSFLSVRYPVPSLGGEKLDMAGVAYYCQDELDFDRQAEHPWLAISLDRFWPPERASADYIVAVTQRAALKDEQLPDPEPWPPITPVW